MAPKHSRASKDGKQYDSNKFVSFEALKRYNDSIMKKIPVAERGFHLGVARFPTLEAEIERRGWTKFCEQPVECGVLPVVREFYANTPEHDNYKVVVKGRSIAFDSETINRYFDLPNIPDDGYNKFLDGEIDLNQVITTLAVPGTTWKLSNGTTISFKAYTLSRNEKAWHYFICAKLMPVTHYSDVVKDRAILLYAISTGLTIDGGKVITQSIINSAQSVRLGLYFPLLITGLCKNAGVCFGPDEDLISPTNTLNSRMIFNLKGGETAGPSNTSGSSSRSSTLTDRLTTLEMEHSQFRAYQINVNNTLGEMARQIALVVGVDMTNFPTLPQYHPYSSSQQDDITQEVEALSPGNHKE